MNYPAIELLLDIIQKSGIYSYHIGDAHIGEKAFQAKDELRALLANATECAQAREKLESDNERLKTEAKYWKEECMKECNKIDDLRSSLDPEYAQANSEGAKLADEVLIKIREIFKRS